MQMARDKEIGQVEVQKTENQILFTDKDETAIYKTGMMPDPDLTQRLFDSGAKFSGEIIQQTDPLLSVLLNYQKETITGEEFMDILNREASKG